MAKAFAILCLLLAVSGAHAARSLKQVFDPYTACGDILNPGYNADGAVNIINAVSNIGCVRTSHYASGGALYQFAAAATGWSYSVKSAGSTTSSGATVQVDFTPANKALRKLTYTIKAGKVKVA